jgi:hypothetical protein
VWGIEGRAGVNQPRKGTRRRWNSAFAEAMADKLAGRASRIVLSQKLYWGFLWDGCDSIYDNQEKHERPLREPVVVGAADERRAVERRRGGAADDQYT